MNYVDNNNLDNLQPTYHSPFLKKVIQKQMQFCFYSMPMKQFLTFYSFVLLSSFFGYLYDFDIFFSF